MKNHRLRRLLPFLTALMLVLTSAVSFAESAAPTAKPQQNENGDYYAIDELKSIGLDLTPYEGKAIIVNFFTTWCYYCNEEMPDFMKAYKNYSKDDLQMVFVHVWDGETDVETKAFQEKHGMQEMTFVEDKDGSIAGSVQVPGYPTSLLIDKDGYLIAGVASMLSYEQLTDYLKQMDVAEEKAM